MPDPQTPDITIPFEDQQANVTIPFEDQQRSTANWGLGLRASMQAGVFGSFGQFLTRGADEPAQPTRTASGVWGAAQAGYQASATGLLQRGRLPDIVLDPSHKKWYESAVSAAASTISDLPEMIAGGAAAGAAGLPSGPGALALGGAAAFATPTAIRQALMTAYSLDQVQSSSDFLNRVGIGIKETGKSAVVGAIMGPAGAGAKGLVAPVAERTFGETGARIATQAAGLGTEYGVLTVAPAALEGRLPEREDFINNAILLGGFHAAGAVSRGLQNVYARTGLRPEEVARDAQADPTILEDLAKTPVPEPTPAPRMAQPPAKAFTPEMSQRIKVEGDSALANSEGAFAAYAQDPHTNGGAILSADLMARVISPTVAESPAHGYAVMSEHGAAAQLTNDLFTQRMSQPPAEAGEPVMVIVGGSATGKSQLAELNKNNYRNILEVPGGDAQGVTDAVNTALKSGRTVDVVLTYADLPEVVKRNFSREAEDHPVSLEDLADTHVKAPQAFSKTAEAFEGNPDVSFTAVDSTSGAFVPHEGPAALEFADAVRKQNAKASVYDSAKAESAKLVSNAIQPEPEIPRAYQELADRQAAADAVPGIPISDTTRAIASDLFGPQVKAPGEPEPTHVNYKYLNTPDQVNGALARMSELNLEEIQRQRRGVVPWEQTEQEAGTYLGRLLGSDGPIQAREPGTAAGAAELLARKQMVEGAALDMVAKAKAIAEAPGIATPEQLADLLVSVDRASMIQSEFLGARAEAGRALNILKDTKTTAERAAEIQAVLDRFGKDPVELAKQLAQIDNPEAAARAARRMMVPGWEQKALEIWKAGLVSGPVTQVANVMGNTTYAATRPLVDATASIFGMLTRAEDRVHYTEPLARIMGDFQGTIDGLKMAKTAFMVEEPGGKAESRNAIPGKTGYIIRTPFRALEALDVMFRTMNERGEAYAMGAREAANEGLNPATREFRERAVDLANNPPEDWIDSIEAFGKRATFRMPLGEKGKAITEAIVKNHLEWIVPFRGTPANIFKELARLSPAAPVIGEWRADWNAGGTAAAKAIAEMTVGSSIAALTMNYAFSGHISGAGDPDPAKRRVQMAAGWQPYSVKVGGTWYSYQRFQPVGTLIGMAADIAEVWKHMTPEESDKVPRMLAVAFSNAVTNQTFLQGITMLVDALSEPDRQGPRLIQNMAASAVPAVVGQTAQFMDDYKREITSTREAVMNRIPGLREQLPVQRDPWGEPAANPSRLGFISPVIESNPSQDKVRTEAARLGVGAQKAPKAVTMPTRGLVQGSLAQVQLTPEQRDVFASVAGKTAHQIMSQMVQSPTWDETPDVIKAKIFQAVLEKSNRIGSMAALSDSQRQQEINRVLDEVTKRLEK